MKTRKLLSVLLAVVLVLGTLAAIGLTVSAEVTEIATAEDLLKISGQSGEYKLTADITLTGTVESFSGTLDGDGHTVTVSAPMFASLSGTVKNLKLAGSITSDATVQVGALANVVPASLTLDSVSSNVAVTAANASGVGGFIGNVVSSAATTVTIRNCINKGAVSAKANVGGFIGYAQNDSSNTSVYTVIDFDYCVNEGAVTMSTTDGGQGAAGFLGYNGKLTDLQVTYCVNKGKVSATGGDYGIGGILGCGSWAREYQKATITYSANYGAISITDDANQRGRVAGIVGRWNRRALSLTIDHCYNMGAIHGGAKGDPDGACGILGYTHKNDKGDTNVITVTNCYNAGVVTAAGGTTYAIGLVHNENAGNTTSSNNYYLTDTAASAGKNIAAAPADKDGLNTALKAIGYLVDPAQNGGFAVLAWQCSHSETTATCVGTTCDICGLQLDENGSGEHDYGDWSTVSGATATTDGEDKRVCGVCNHEDTRAVDATGKITPVDGVYYVENEDQMLWLAYNMNNGTVSASSDIVLKADITLTNGMTFIDKSYKGTFDGKGHTLSGLNYTIFNALDGTVKNIVLKGDIDYTGISDNNRARKASTIAFDGTGFTVENVVSYVNISSKAKDLNAGAIVGYSTGAFTFNRVTYAGNYTMEWTGSGGGLGAMFGWGNASGSTATLTDCTFSGTMTLKGDAPDGTLRVGAVAGFGGNGTYNLTRCTNTGTVNYEITDETVFGGIYAGGIIGRLEKDFTMSDCVVAGTSSKDNKDNYGAFIGYCNTKGNTVKHCVTFITETATDNGVITNYVGNGEKAHSYVDCYDKLMVEAIGEPVTIGGVAYQEYNFGYLNAATKAMQTFNYSQGNITKVDDTNYTIGSYDLSAFVSSRLTDVLGYNDLRFIIAADRKGLDAYQSLTLSIVFKKGDSEVFTVKKDLATELYAYKSAIAAGNTYTAAEGSVLFGMVITDVPVGAWDTVTVSLYDESDRSVATGQQTSKNVTTAATLDVYYYGIENHHASANYQGVLATYVYDHAFEKASSISDKLLSGDYVMEIICNGKSYTVVDPNCGGNMMRPNLETAGIAFKKGDALSIQFNIYDKDGNQLFTSGAWNGTASFYTHQYHYLEEAPDYAKLEKVTSSSVEGISHGSSEGVDKLFDGKLTGGKLCGTATGSFTVNFTLASPAKLKYYTFTTGGDTATYPSRNPSGWVLYGKVGEEWVVLADQTNLSVLTAVNNTDFVFAIPNPVSCSEYKITFTVSGTFQMNEMRVYSSSTEDVESDSVTSEGFTPWGDGEVPGKLFDNNLSSKMGGNTSDGKVTVFFNTTEALTLTYYTLITGTDTASYASRNPNGWVLYGKVDGEWVVLDTVETSPLEAVNSKEYAFAIDTPQSCSQYKIEFAVNGSFQMTEMTLHTDEYGKSVVKSASTTGLNHWGDGPVTNLFDGKATGSSTTKMGGNTSNDTPTVYFTLSGNMPVTRYIITTGNDTSGGRNPDSWVLYGKVGEEWIVLDEVNPSDLPMENNASKEYAIDTPTTCSEYKIEFKKSGQFQLNELELRYD